MKKIAVFNVANADTANKHLAQFPPEQVAIVDENIVIHYDDQTYPDSYKAEELRGLMLSNEKGMMTTNISIKVSLLELADAEASLADAEQKLKDIQETTIHSPNKENKKDLKSDRNEKIRAYQFAVEQLKGKVKNIEGAINGLKGSIKNFENKNKVLGEELALLKL